MAPRQRFALVYFEDLQAAEVFRQDKVTGNFAVNSRVTITVEDNPREDPKTVTGKILLIGTKTMLVAKKVLKSGTLVNDGANNVTSCLAVSRKKTIADNAKKIAHARSIQLQSLDEILQSHGPAALPSPPPQPYNKLPKKRPPETIALLQKELNELDCFKPTLGWVSIGGGVFAPAKELAIVLTYQRTHVSRLFRALIKLLVPNWLLATPGVSVSGTKGTAQVPPLLVAAAKSYAVRNALKQGSCEFQPLKSLSNLLTEMQGCKKPVPETNPIQSPATNQTTTVSTPGNTSEVQGFSLGGVIQGAMNDLEQL